MVIYTSKLNLYKPNPQEDGESTFNIDTMLNENWDKIDQNAGETNDKLGDLSQLETTDKSSLVNANNEIKNNLVTHLNDYTQLKEELTQPDTLTTPKQISSIMSLPNAIDGQASVGVNGRAVNNLMGDAGNCEDLSKWSVIGSNPSVDTTIKLFGESSFKTTSSATAASYVWKDYNDLEAKYYFASVYAYLTSSSGYVRIVVFDKGSFDNAILTQTDATIVNSWQRIAIKVTKTNGFRIGVGRTSPGEISDNFDGIMVNEITKDEYDNLTEDELMQKYPYISGTKSTTNTRIKSVGKNLFDKNIMRYDGYRISETSGALYSSTDDRGHSDYIKIKPDTNYFSEYNLKNFAWYDINKNYLSGESSFVGLYHSPANAYYLRVSTRESLKDIAQIEEGPTATTYEPYKESISYITLPEGVDGLHSLPNGVKDEVTPDGKLIKRAGKVLVSNNFTYSFTSSYADKNIYVLWVKNFLEDYNAKKSTSPFGDAIATNDLAQFKINNTTINVPYELSLHFSGNLYLSLPKDYIDASYTSDLSGCLAYLNDHPITLIYQLAEPQIYDLAITPVTCFKDGTIYIESADDSQEYVVPETQFEYPVNTAGVIQGNVEGINELGNTMNLKANKAMGQEFKLPLQNGWAGNLFYSMNDLGQVHLQANLVAGIVTPGTVIGKIPEKYRPTRIKSINVYNTSSGISHVGLFISSTGNIGIRDPASQTLSSGRAIELDILYQTL